MRHARTLTSLLFAAATMSCGDASSPSAPDQKLLVPDGPQLITSGRPTGTDYGGVGALLADVGNNLTVDYLCSGSLISPTVFLTAGHCIGPAGTVYYISFAPDVIPLPPISQLIKSSVAFKSTTDDIGVIILPAGSTIGVPVYDIPTLGFLSQLNQRGGLARETAVLVGYGVASLGRGPLLSGLDGVRKVATAKILYLLGRQIVIADAHGQSGQGGTCSGDSGGPVFLEGQDPDLIVAITSFGFPAGCHAFGVYVRIDTPTALAFLGQFVGL